MTPAQPVKRRSSRWSLTALVVCGLAPAPLMAEPPAPSSGAVAAAAEHDRLRAAGARAFTEGAFERAVAELAAADARGGHQPDPELHYLRGEALYALHRDDEAAREHQLVEQELGPAPPARIQKLWLARVYARRGELGRADAVYESLWPPAPAVDAEAAINQAEAHTLRRDWSGARRILSRLLDRDPHHVRAREMLAWVLEVTGDLDGELPLRSGLAADRPTAETWGAWGRALERAGDFPGARDRYENAVAAGAGTDDKPLAAALARMRYRTTPELSGGLAARRDPQADALRWQAGAALPFGPRHDVALVGWHETSSGQVLRRGALIDGDGASTGLRGSVALGARGGAALMLAGDVRDTTSASTDGPGSPTVDRLQGGATAEVKAPFLGHAEAHLRGEVDEPWTDAAVTLSEGGSVTGGAGDVFLFPSSRRLLLSLGGQWRQLRLTGAPGQAAPTATQRLIVGGVDLVLWSNPGRQLRCEALDDAMAVRTSFSDAAILSYRHEQMWGDAAPEFTSRISLAPRAAVHVGSATVRKVVIAERAGLEARGAFGYDVARSAVIYTAGGAASLAFSWSTKLLVSYEATRESAMGFTGTRQAGWVTFHADL